MRPSVILALAALAGSGAAFAPHGGIFTRTVTRTAAEKKGGLTLPTFGKKAAPAKEPAKKKGIAGGIQFPTRAIPESDKAVLPVRQKVGGVVKGTVNKLPFLSGVRLEGLVGTFDPPSPLPTIFLCLHPSDPSYIIRTSP